MAKKTAPKKKPVARRKTLQSIYMSERDYAPIEELIQQVVEAGWVDYGRSQLISTFYRMIREAIESGYLDISRIQDPVTEREVLLEAFRKLKR